MSLLGGVLRVVLAAGQSPQSPVNTVVSKYLCPLIGLAVVAVIIRAILDSLEPDRSSRRRLRSSRRPQSAAPSPLEVLEWIIAGIARLIRRAFGKAEGPPLGHRYVGAPGQQVRLAAYFRRKNLLSQGELAFFLALEHVVAGRYRIFSMVRLGDLVQVAPEARGQGYAKKINQLHVDFVLCDMERCRLLLAIELDDRTHRRAKRRERDRFVDECLKAALLPILRVPAQQAYDVRALDAMIQAKLSGRAARQKT